MSIIFSPGPGSATPVTPGLETASNGLTAVGTDVRLGGALDAGTEITGENVGLSIAMTDGAGAATSVFFDSSGHAVQTSNVDGDNGAYQFNASNFFIGVGLGAGGSFSIESNSGFLNFTFVSLAGDQCTVELSALGSVLAYQNGPNIQRLNLVNGGSTFEDTTTQKGLGNLDDYRALATPKTYSQVNGNAYIVARSVTDTSAANQTAIDYNYLIGNPLGGISFFRVSAFVVQNSGAGTINIHIAWIDRFDVTQTLDVPVVGNMADVTKLIQIKSSGNVTVDYQVTGVVDYTAGCFLEAVMV